jgi:peroxiredoxin
VIPESNVQLPTGLPKGAFLSDFALPNLRGDIVRVSDLVGSSYLLLFVSPTCEPSADVLRYLESLRKTDLRIPRVIVVSSGGHEAAQSVATRFGLGENVVVQEEEELLLFMRVPATPAAYRVNADRTTAGPLAIGAGAVIAMLPQVMTPFEPNLELQETEPRAKPIEAPAGPRRAGLPVGELAPELSRAGFEDEVGLISANRGWWTLLVFWSPGCAPCDEIAGQLADLVTTASQLAVIVVSRGTERDAQALSALLGPGVPVVLQEGRSISRRYATFYAPAAYLLDPDGRIAEPLARGVRAVGQLLERAQARAGAALS